ncbi:hypothetical protein [Bradyrhizobium forestalis]|uniref:hypothetical protein n=1 Tax=Bradyrhizobium forestalis TaxID=1419263 RepID=UPI0011AF672F|nr:hypothetical protein [Bradyrhizobium forestalis]
MQKFLHSLFVARPHYFNFATPAMGGGGPDIGPLQPIAVPGSNAGIEYSLSFTEPRIRFFPSAFNPAPPAPLPIAANHFGISTDVKMCILADTGGVPTKFCGTISFWAVGRPVQIGAGTSAVVSLSAQQALVSGTGNLDRLCEQIVTKILNALLRQLQIPVKLLPQGAFQITLERGPEINSPSGNPPGQMQIWGGLS